MCTDRQLGYKDSQFLGHATADYTQSKIAGVIKFLFFELVWCTLLLVVSKELTSSWDFLEAVI